MKILVSCASSWNKESIIQRNSVEEVLNELKSGAMDISSLLGDNSSLKDSFGSYKLPTHFIVAYRSNDEKVDVDVTIYDDYVE